MRRIVGLLIRCQVAARGSALGRESHELPGRGVGVAHVAFHHRVRAQQREPVEVILDRLNGYIPAGGSVALGAIGAHLAAMNIRVAVRAILSHVGEDRFYVAFRAAHFFVHSAEGKPRGVVIEFGNGANRSPTGAGMAVLARNCERTVRALARLLLGIRRANKNERQNH